MGLSEEELLEEWHRRWGSRYGLLFPAQRETFKARALALGLTEMPAKHVKSGIKGDSKLDNVHAYVVRAE